MPQMFVHRDGNNAVSLLMAKVVDDILLCGKRGVVASFHERMSRKFELGRFILEKNLIFNRFSIHRADDGSITADMKEFMDTIQKLPLSRERRKEKDSSCTDAEKTSFLGLTGKLNYLGHGTLPPAAFAASHLQQKCW